jgi:oligoendopeptidase F
MPELQNLQLATRAFLPETLKITSWETIRPFYEELLKREIFSVDDLRQWFKDRSELESVVEEDAAWRYIHMTRDTADTQKLEAYTFFVNEIEPKIAPISDQLNRKAVDSEFIEELTKDPALNIVVRLMRKDIEIFREENVPLKAESQVESQKFAAISGAMTIVHDEKELTLQQASALLEEQERDLRQKIFEKMAARRLRDSKPLDDLFDKLVRIRDRIAKNAGFENFRDYSFVAMGRMDYTPKDCFKFHDSVREEITPLLNKIAKERKKTMGLKVLKPWDNAVDPTGKPPLKPYKDAGELIEKTIACFNKLDPFFGDCLDDMNKKGYMDLDSRKGKAPGGYNYPLAESGAPFIFMNSSATLNDLVTMVHEGGHAIHTYLMRDLELNMFRHIPSEVAELASMAMELLSMEHWDVFFDNEEDLKRAKKKHLQQIVATLPWTATVDKFQHWIYENPNHTPIERNDTWDNIYTSLLDNVTNWEDQEIFRRFSWQKQLHLYEVPFYYIEYGIAQLAALAIWKNFRINREKALDGYINALKLGYSRSIPEIFEAADVKFDFSRGNISELMEFLEDELAKLS